MSGDVMAALDARHEGASRRLHVAVRLELNRFVSAAIEDRLRARPLFLAGLSAGARQSLRERVDRDAFEAAESVAQPVADLRVYYGAETRTIEQEDRGFASTIADAAHAVAASLLGALAVPGDDTPDSPEGAAGAREAGHALRFVPSSSLMWAWRQVRELDTVRNQLADGAPPSFETRWHLPELVDGD